MKSLVLALIFASASFYLMGCASPEPMPYTPTMEAPRAKPSDPNQSLRSALGMTRDATDLGYDEKSFDPCSFGLTSQSGCGHQYFAVVHFQLLCRDSEGTISMAGNVQPIVSDHMTWQLNGMTGPTQTDDRGYGQFSVVSRKSTKNQRLILHIGPQFVAFNVSEVTRVVLPKNFCRSRS
jgi:hypothetical protein